MRKGFLGRGNSNEQSWHEPWPFRGRGLSQHGGRRWGGAWIDGASKRKRIRKAGRGQIQETLNPILKILTFVLQGGTGSMTKRLAHGFCGRRSLGSSSGYDSRSVLY